MIYHFTEPALIKKVWTIAKLVYLYLGYFLVGMDDAYFYTLKGNYFTDLAWYHRAVPNYKKALKKSQDPKIHFVLAFCLVRLGRFNESIEHFRAAYEKLPEPDVALGLAIAEYETGNVDHSRVIVQGLDKSDGQARLINKAAYIKLKGLLGKPSSQMRTTQETTADASGQERATLFGKASFGIWLFGSLSVVFSLFIMVRVALPRMTYGIDSVNILYFATSICWFICGIGAIKRHQWARRGLIFLSIIYIFDSIQQPLRIRRAIISADWYTLSTLTIGTIFLGALLIYLSLPQIRYQFSEQEKNNQ